LWRGWYGFGQEGGRTEKERGKRGKNRETEQETKKTRVTIIIERVVFRVRRTLAGRPLIVTYLLYFASPAEETNMSGFPDEGQKGEIRHFYYALL
jgi:hypothetical protein